MSEELAKEARFEMFRWAADAVRHEFAAATWSVFVETCLKGRAIYDVAQEFEQKQESCLHRAM